MTRANALTRARLAGHQNDTREFTRLIIECRVNRQMMLRAWYQGRELAEREATAAAKSPAPPDRTTLPLVRPC